MTGCCSPEKTIGHVFAVGTGPLHLLRLDWLLKILNVDSQVNGLVVVAGLPLDSLGSVLDAQDGSLLHAVVVDLGSSGVGSWSLVGLPTTVIVLLLRGVCPCLVAQA